MYLSRGVWDINEVNPSLALPRDQLLSHCICSYVVQRSTCHASQGQTRCGGPVCSSQGSPKPGTSSLGCPSFHCSDLRTVSRTEEWKHEASVVFLPPLETQFDPLEQPERNRMSVTRVCWQLRCVPDEPIHWIKILVCFPSHQGVFRADQLLSFQWDKSLAAWAILFIT